MSEREALAALRRQAGLGRLPGKLVDALEPLVVSDRPGTPPAPGRFEGGGGLQPGAKPEDPDDPPSRMRPRLTAAVGQPAGLTLSL
jgi:hypothetical protein